MICKGNTHKNGAKLARYMTTGKDGERAELWALVGFAAGDIREAFRSVHVMAEATRCQQPFFHVQVRNPDDEELSQAEWRHVVDRIEAKLGLTGQPCAIAFHTEEETGHEHMHVAWSRIDSETMTARPLPFFKERLKEVARQLEKELDLTRVKNERDTSIRAPSRDEFEQARRLGVDIREVRETIRQCWEQSDCGRSFEAALADEGLLLAKGDRRDFIVIDSQGGMHALGQRILGISAAETRARMADLSRDHLPSVEQARNHQKDSREKEPVWDRDRYDRQWQDAVARAAIEKNQSEKGRGAEPVKPPETEVEPLPNLRGVALEIWRSYNSSRDADSFQKSLDKSGFYLSRASEDDVRHSHTYKFVAERFGKYYPILREGEYVVLDERGHGYRLNDRTTSADFRSIQEFMAPLDPAPVKSLWETRRIIEERRIENIDHGNDSDPASRELRTTLKHGARILDTTATRAKKAMRAPGKVMEFAGSAIEGFFAPTLTPAQKREAERAARFRTAEAEDAADLSRQVAAQAEARRQEQERAAYERHRHDRER